MLDLGDRSALSYQAPRAELYEKLGEYDKALEDINRAIKIDDQDPELYKTRAEIHRDLGDSDRMLSDITRASELESENITSRARELAARPMTPENEEATLEEFSKIRDNYASTLKKIEERGRSELTESLRLGLVQMDIQLLGRRAAVCKNQKKWAEARGHLKKALELTEKYALTNWREQIQQELARVETSTKSTELMIKKRKPTSSRRLP